MNLPALSPLMNLNNVRVHAGAKSTDIKIIENKYKIKLPELHKNVLLETNGIEIFSNYFRLFGTNCQQSIDILHWNDEQYWKFAWDNRCSPYICFGETAWGDQYAYEIEKLQNGDESVFFLDCLSMTPTIIAPSFADFMDMEFLRSAKEPYDTMIIEAQRKFGDIDISEHLIYTRPILLGGSENIENIQKIPARSAMICNGDIAVELDAGPDDRTVVSVMQYKDEANRTRLHLVWS